ncbi:MAG: PIN domain-containing protein [Chlamydiales bacterium]|nr:PIN domain-containing protein [Chlamydiales bacterium]
MNYLLDTCVVSDFFKKQNQTVEKFKTLSPKQLHISTVTVMEIEYGLALNPEKAKKLRPIWDSLLKATVVLPYCHACAENTATARAFLKGSGKLIGPYDIQLVGTALAHNLSVVTSNISEFSRSPELTVENWRL